MQRSRNREHEVEVYPSTVTKTETLVCRRPTGLRLAPESLCVSGMSPGRAVCCSGSGAEEHFIPIWAGWGRPPAKVQFELQKPRLRRDRERMRATVDEADVAMRHLEY